jgi:hypothetical protein
MEKLLDRTIREAACEIRSVKVQLSEGAGLFGLFDPFRIENFNCEWEIFKETVDRLLISDQDAPSVVVVVDCPRSKMPLCWNAHLTPSCRLSLVRSIQEERYNLAAFATDSLKSDVDTILGRHGWKSPS